LKRLRQIRAGSLGAFTIALLLSWNAAPVSAEVTNTSFELTDHRGERLSDKELCL